MFLVGAQVTGQQNRPLVLDAVNRWMHLTRSTSWTVTPLHPNLVNHREGAPGGRNLQSASVTWSAPFACCIDFASSTRLALLQAVVDLGEADARAHGNVLLALEEDGVGHGLFLPLIKR